MGDLSKWKNMENDFIVMSDLPKKMIVVTKGEKERVVSL